MNTDNAVTPQATTPQARTFIVPSLLAAGALGLLGWLGDPLALTVLGYLPVQIVRQFAGDSDALALLWDPALLRSFGVLLGCALLFAAAYATLPHRPMFAALASQRVRRIRDIAVGLAIVIPVGYAITRFAWALGIPLGTDPEFLTRYRDIMTSGAALGASAIVGAVLTWGLTRPWGARFPRWMPVVGGRGVPIGLARNSAVTAGLFVLAAGCYFVRSMITGDLSIAPEGAADQIAAWLPEMFWPLWGLALAAAGLAYAELRRRLHDDDVPAAR